MKYSGISIRKSKDISGIKVHREEIDIELSPFADDLLFS